MSLTTLASSFDGKVSIRPTSDFVSIAQDIFSLSDPTKLIGFGAKLFDNKRGHERPFPLIPIPIGELPDYRAALDFHRGTFSQVQYWCLNPLNQPSQKYPIKTYLEALHRKIKPKYFDKSFDFCASLTALCLDLDVGRSALVNANDAWARVWDLAGAGDIPRPSLTGFSGRGCYVVYLLRDDDDPARPAQRSKANAVRFALAVDALAERFEGYEPDVGPSKSVVQWFKRPGAVCDKTGRTVVYHRWYAEGFPRRYSLADLHRALDIRPDHAPAPRRPASSRSTLPTPRPARRPRSPDSYQVTAAEPWRGLPVLHGFEAAAARLRDLDRLVPHIEPGTRHYFLLTYYCAALRFHAPSGRAAAREAAAAATERVNRELQRPSKPVELAAATHRRNRPGVHHRRTVVGWLDITPDVAERFELQTLRPDSIVDREKDERDAARQAKRDLQARVDAALLSAGKEKVSPAEIARRFGTTRFYVRDRWNRLRRRTGAL